MKNKTRTKPAIVIGSLVLIGAMALTLTNCGTSNSEPDVDADVDNDNDTKYETVFDSDDVEQNKNPDYIISGGNDNGTNSSNENKETDKSTETKDLTETKPQRVYTEALQYVLNNPEYNALIAQSKSEASTNKAQNSETWLGGKVSHNPYGFFEKQGFDVNNIKNQTLHSSTRVFTRYSEHNEPNNLYVCASAEIQAEVPYMIQYILKYTLTDKEMEEFKWLHANNYMQAMFMVDAYSRMKTPEIINECKIATRAYKGLCDSLPQKSVTSTLLDGQGLSDIIMLNFSEEEGKAQILLIGNTSVSNTAVPSNLNVANITENASYIKANENGAYDNAYTILGFKLLVADNQTLPEKTIAYRKVTITDDTKDLTTDPIK